MSYWAAYLPGWWALAALGACAAVVLALGAVGNAVSRRPAAGAGDVITGWALAAGALLPLQWLWPVDLRWWAALLGVAVLWALWARRDAVLHAAWWKPAPFLLPALVVAAGAPLDAWDSFSHWGINAAYLWRFDALPHPELPASPSSNPDYPYGYPLLLYLAGLLRGAYIENAGVIVNLLLLTVAAAALASLFAEAGTRRRRPGWGHAALGVLAAFPLNPGFTRSTAMAAYADVALGLGLLVLVLELWRWSLAWATGGGREHAWRAAAAGVALVCIKETGALLLGLAVGAALAVALACLETRRARALAVPLLVAVPGLGLAAAWQGYTAGWMHTSFHLLPWADWRWHLLPEMLAGMWTEIAKHGVYYLLAAAVSAAGLWSLLRRPAAAGRLLAMTALVFLGHLGTLLAAYLGATFSEAEAARAASFWRYTTQPAWLVVAAAVFATMQRLGRSEPCGARARAWLCGLTVALLIAGSPYLKRDRDPYEAFMLERGAWMARNLPPQSSVLLLGWERDSYAYFLLRYAFYRPGEPEPGPSLERHFPGAVPADGARLQRLLEETPPDGTDFLLLVHAGDLQVAAGADMLLYRRQPAGWHLMEAWRQE